MLLWQLAKLGRRNGKRLRARRGGEDTTVVQTLRCIAEVDLYVINHQKTKRMESACVDRTNGFARARLARHKRLLPLP